MNIDALLIVLFFSVCAAGVVLTAILSEKFSRLIPAWFGSIASAVVIVAGGRLLLMGNMFTVKLWTIPSFGTLMVTMDRLSGFFILITGMVFLAVSIFSAGCLSRLYEILRKSGAYFNLRCGQSRIRIRSAHGSCMGRYSLRAFSILYLSLFASIIAILISGDVLLFLLAWESMSILTYLLVNYEHLKEGNAGAGYEMLAFSEAGTLAVAVGLLILSVSAGSFDFASLKAAAPALGTGMKWAVFLLIFFGFGVKAGLVPVNSWLPRAYTAAPAAFLPILAGAMLNLGLYGIMRFNVDITLFEMPGPGLIMLVVGTLSALIGILYATTENDLKTMLAHSSIENAGLVTVGLGAGWVFTSYHMPAIAGIAFVAAGYHMTNHSFYKTLLLMGCGVVEENTGSRDLDKLGGLIRTMPWTAVFFLVGVMSIAALPPFNGFVSEWLTLQTMLRSVELSSLGVKIVFAICGAGLALTAALVMTCFVKAFAMGFLGMSRSTEAAQSKSARRSALIPMGLLAVICFGLGILPTYVIPVLAPAVTPAASIKGVKALVPPFFGASYSGEQLPSDFIGEFHDLGAQIGTGVLPGRGLVVLHRGGKENPVVFAMSTSYMVVVLSILLAIVYCITKICTRRRKVIRGPCWDGGVRDLRPGMTYTATGFSNPVRIIFDAIFHPTTIENRSETIAAHFRTQILRQERQVHIVDRLVRGPATNLAMALAHGLGRMHHGRMNAYLAYVLLSLLVVFVIALFL